MPNPNARPQVPGKVSIDVTPGAGSVIIDDYDIGQHVSAMQLRFDAAKRKPVLMLDLLPSAINVTGEGVEMTGPFRDFLIAHGWRPPE
jgi:hypothetical protein